MKKDFRITLESGTEKHISAETLQVKGGCLVFENLGVVEAYAQGTWHRVECLGFTDPEAVDKMVKETIRRGLENVA